MNTGSKLLRFGLAVLLFSFICYQIYASFYNPLITASAVYYDTYDGIDITGVIVRDETLISSGTAGVKRYIVADGERVAKNGVIAEVYDSAETSGKFSRVDELNAQINSLKSISSFNDPTAVDLNLLNAKIDDAYLGMLSSCSGGNFLDSKQYSSELLTLINRKQVITGDVSNFDNQIAALQTELNSLKANLPSSVQKISSSKSGYFVSKADGFESVFKTDSLNAITPELLENLKPQTIASNNVGKIVSDYTWYIAAAVSADTALKLKQGESLTMRTSLKFSPELAVTVKQVNVSSASSGDSVVIFSCNEMNSELSTSRVVPMTIVLKSYSGIRVSNKAVRILNGKTGVYVVQGAEIKFKSIKTVFSNNSFTVCEQDQTGSENCLRLYDQVVERGRNLKDGKLIK